MLLLGLLFVNGDRIDSHLDRLTLNVGLRASRDPTPDEMDFGF
jgi:hypothetical protein